MVVFSLGNLFDLVILILCGRLLVLMVSISNMVFW